MILSNNKKSGNKQKYTSPDQTRKFQISTVKRQRIIILTVFNCVLVLQHVGGDG